MTFAMKHNCTLLIIFLVFSLSGMKCGDMQVQLPDPIVHYKFDNSEDLGFDSSPDPDLTPLHATNISVVPNQEPVTHTDDGVINGAAVFNGRQFLEIIDPVGTDESRLNFANGSFTISFWFYNLNIRQNNEEPNQLVWTSPSVGRTNYFAIFSSLRTGGDNVVLPGELIAKINSGSDDLSGFLNASYGEPKEKETWHHYAVVRGDTSVKTYVNRVEVNSVPLNGANHIFEPTQPGRIGVFGSANATDFLPEMVSDEFLHGQLDDFRIYNQSLTAAQIRAIFESAEFNVETQMPNN